MENASKALIIAGEVLIGIMILSLASYLILSFGNYSRNLNERISESEITQFNVRFTNLAYRANISSQDIASIVNFAKQSNTRYEASPGDDFYTDVLIDGTSVISNDINEFLTNNGNSTYYYCNLTNVRIDNINDSAAEVTITASTTENDITFNPRTGLVTRIVFHPIYDASGNYANAILNGYEIIRN